MEETTKEINQLPDVVNGLTDTIKKSPDAIIATPENIKKDISQYPAFESLINKESNQDVKQWLNSTTKTLFDEYDKKWEAEFLADNFEEAWKNLKTTNTDEFESDLAVNISLFRKQLENIKNKQAIKEKDETGGVVVGNATEIKSNEEKIAEHKEFLNTKQQEYAAIPDVNKPTTADLIKYKDTDPQVKSFVEEYGKEYDQSDLDFYLSYRYAAGEVAKKYSGYHTGKEVSSDDVKVIENYNAINTSLNISKEFNFSVPNIEPNGGGRQLEDNSTSSDILDPKFDISATLVNYSPDLKEFSDKDSKEDNANFDEEKFLKDDAFKWQRELLEKNLWVTTPLNESIKEWLEKNKDKQILNKDTQKPEPLFSSTETYLWYVDKKTWKVDEQKMKDEKVDATRIKALQDIVKSVRDVKLQEAGKQVTETWNLITSQKTLSAVVTDTCQYLDQKSPTMKDSNGNEQKFSDNFTISKDKWFKVNGDTLSIQWTFKWQEITLYRNLSTGKLEVDEFIHFDAWSGTFHIWDKSKENGRKTIAMLDSMKTVNDKIKPQITKSAFEAASKLEKPLGNDFAGNLSKEVWNVYNSNRNPVVQDLLEQSINQNVSDKKFDDLKNMCCPPEQEGKVSRESPIRSVVNFQTNSKNYYTPKEAADYESGLTLLPTIIKDMNSDATSAFKKDPILSSLFSTKRLEAEKGNHYYADWPALWQFLKAFTFDSEDPIRSKVINPDLFGKVMKWLNQKTDDNKYISLTDILKDPKPPHMFQVYLSLWFKFSKLGPA